MSWMGLDPFGVVHCTQFNRYSDDLKTEYIRKSEVNFLVKAAHQSIVV